MEFRLLGTLEVADGDRTLALGGVRQRAFLTLLLLHRNEVVTQDRIVEELWAGQPPRTAAQVIRVYVSQLRKVLEPDRGSEPPQVLLTHGAGYLLRTQPDQVDVDRFDALRTQGRRLLDEGDPAEAARVLGKALALWRGPALGDVAYESFAQPHIAHLEELRLATLEDRFAAELASGHDAELVADLERLVEANPLRERIRGQLMLALYRSGRQADALAVYADGRRHLVDELGLEPGAELRRLEAAILRQEPELARPLQAPAAPARPPARRRRRLVLLIAGVAGLGAAAVAVVVFVDPGSSRDTRVTVVMPGRPQLNPDPVDGGVLDGANAAQHDLGAKVEILYTGSGSSKGLAATLTRAAQRSGLVVVGPLPYADIVARVARAHPRTRFLFGEYPIKEPPFNGMRNVTTISYDNREIGYLAGYLAALMTRTHTVSVVAGVTVPPVIGLVDGYRAGAHAAAKNVKVLVDYSGSFVDQSLCEQRANAQLDAGSTVVFDAAGDCGFGALEAAGIRGAWGIGVDSDLSYLGPHIIASAVKRLDRAPELAIKLFLDGSLPGGQNILLDLGSDSVGLVGISSSVPPGVRDRLERVAADLRQRDRKRSPTG